MNAGRSLAEQPRFHLGYRLIEMRVDAGKILAGVRISDPRQVHFAAPRAGCSASESREARRAAARRTCAISASHRVGRDQRIDDRFLGRLGHRLEHRVDPGICESGRSALGLFWSGPVDLGGSGRES